MVGKLQPEAIPRRLQHRQRAGASNDCERQMSATVRRRVLVSVSVLATALSVSTGCTRSVVGAAVKAVAGDVPRNNTSEQQYPNLQKECEVLTTDVLAKTVGADPQDIQSTFVGAICRWQAANPGGLIDITRFWFEQGSLDNERKVAEFLKYQIENRAIAGVPSIVMKPNDPNGSGGVGSDAAGGGGGGGTPRAHRIVEHSVRW